jgi:hypothetical protein
MDTNKSFYLDLEQELFSLMSHYAHCKGATDGETADWAKFFQTWSRKAAKVCGAWSLENMHLAEKLTQSFERSRTGMKGYEVLENAMAQAWVSLGREIKEELKGLVPII